MPRGDRTGPQGMGPRTGRAAGYCGGYNVPGCADPIPGRGMAWRRGWGGGGYGWGNVAWSAPPSAAPLPPTPMDEKTILNQQIVALQAQLDYLSERLKALQKKGEGEE